MENLLISVYRLINIYNSKSRSAHIYECGERLYPAQSHLLETIGTHQGITQTEVAAMLYVTKAAVSQSVKQLCTMGLVVREDKNTVGGAQELYLTDKGREVFTEHRRRHSDMINAVGKVWDTLSEDAKNGIMEILSVTEKHIMDMEE